MTGKIKWYSPSKGYGFIVTPDYEVFFHKSQLHKDLKPEAGTKIEFDMYETGKNKYEAKEITLLYD